MQWGRAGWGWGWRRGGAAACGGCGGPCGRPCASWASSRRRGPASSNTCPPRSAPASFRGPPPSRGLRAGVSSGGQRVFVRCSTLPGAVGWQKVPNSERFNNVIPRFLSVKEGLCETRSLCRSLKLLLVLQDVIQLRFIWDFCFFRFCVNGTHHHKSVLAASKQVFFLFVDTVRLCGCVFLCCR